MASTAVLLTRGLRFAPAAFAESPPIRAAMHVHGCWSEGGAEYGASWAQQCAQAATNGIDVMWMTDHTHHQEALKLASGFAFTEEETTWVTATSPAGSLAQVVNGALRNTERFDAMREFFAGVGTGATSGVWEDTPVDHPEFREHYRRHLQKKARQAKAEEMI